MARHSGVVPSYLVAPRWALPAVSGRHRRAVEVHVPTRTLAAGSVLLAALLASFYEGPSYPSPSSLQGGAFQRVSASLPAPSEVFRQMLLDADD